MSKYATFFNDNFFDGPKDRVCRLIISVADSKVNSFVYPKMYLHGAQLIDLDYFELAPGPLSFSVTILGGESMVTPPVEIARATATLEAIFTAAHQLPANGVGEEEHEEDAAEEVAGIDYVDFEKIEYGRTENSSKTYYLERLTAAAAQKMGQDYRIYKGGTNPPEFLSSNGPVYRAIVKQYEIDNGLREA